MIATSRSALALFFSFFVASLAIACARDRAEDRPPANLGPSGGADGAKGDGGSPGPDAAPPGDGAPSVHGGPSGVRFVGRFDTRDPAGPWCAWPGCRIVARFTGTSVSARLNERVEPWMEGGPSEWDVAIDGKWQPKVVLQTGAHDYVLADGLAGGTHTVELYKRSEAQNGTTQFLGYTFPGGALEAPPPAPARRIEIIGDSQPAAFGVEGVGDCPPHNWAARWQNFRRSFGAILGETFAADVHGIVHSGKGLVRNIWRPDPLTFPIIYPRTLPNDATSDYDFSLFVPDVVVIMIGGNDFDIGQPSDDGPSPPEEFTEAYRRLVAFIRESAPDAHVFLAASPSVTDAQPPDRQSRTHVVSAIDTVAAERSRAGDARVYVASPGLAPPSELTGCEGHGNPAFHERVANELAASIRSRTGW
ncbi:MAG: hypothetical protein KF819_19050 [Labilithrix sp.]|nr:hypothetical protein [Labilithrix sp.]